MKKRITKDFESRSEVNLKKVGAYKYSIHHSTKPTCFSFKKHGHPVVYFLDFHAINKPWKEQSIVLQDMWIRFILEGYQFSAHNSFFERCIYDNILVKRYGWPPIPPRQRRCTAAKAAACALPRNLEGAGEAMRLRIQKDRRGYSAMMATCKPTKSWKAWKKLQDKISNGGKLTSRQIKAFEKPEPPMFLEPEAAPEVWSTLYEYCKIDTRTEELLDDSLPDLNPAEQEIWFFNQRLNWRGLPIDMPTVKKASTIMTVESAELREELDEITMGLVKSPGAIKSILNFLLIDGVELPNLRAKTVDEILKTRNDLDSDMVRLLEIRQALSKSSTKKYQTFLDRAADDYRVRDVLLYHGASTGRDTGVGIQPHNFPRGLIKVEKSRPYAAIENVIECDHEMLNILYGPSLGILFSSILRNMILPSPGCELFVADFSKIEVAVLWWLAGNETGLEILRSGKDPYIYQAAENLGKSYEEVEEAVLREERWALDARQLGKAQILGNGFGMGAAKFKTTAWDMYGLALTEKQSKEAVDSYRETHSTVPALWEAYEVAAIQAVEYGGIRMTGKCKFFSRDQFLWIELPSGRRLAYRDPQISWRVREYEVWEDMEKGKLPVIKDDPLSRFNEEKQVWQKSVKRQTAPKKTLEFMAVNSKTKKWALERSWGGTLTENCVQAVARDLMMPAMLRLEKRGYRGLISIHDEGICEKMIGHGDIEEFIKILCEVPPWGAGLPIEAKGWKGPRYRK